MRPRLKKPPIEAEPPSSEDDLDSSSDEEEKKDQGTMPSSPSSSDDDDGDDDGEYEEDETPQQASNAKINRRTSSRRRKSVKKKSKAKRTASTDDAQPKRKQRRKNHIESGCHRLMDHDATEGIGQNRTLLAEDDRIEALIAKGRWAFCCAKCACPPHVQEKAARILRYVVSGDGRFPHRPCCHGFGGDQKLPSDEWASSYETAQANAAEAWNQLMEQMAQQQPNCDEDVKPPATPVDGHDTVDAKLVHSKYLNAKRLESTFANFSKAEDPTTALYTDENYQAVAKEFRAHQLRDLTERRGATVLDLFSGMGTAMVALKRLGVAMQKVIHCEQDKVANFVYQQHHNPQVDGGTEYAHYNRFEQIFRFADDQIYNDFMDAHAPIDLVVGGPPCQDFTGINASREGLDGGKGSYMIAAASLVRRIQDDVRQKGRPLYYLLENVVLSNDKDLPLSQGDKAQIQSALKCSWSPVDLDAACVSPCTRLRSFFTNIRLRSWTESKGYQEDLLSNPTSVLDDGYRLAANLYEPDMLAKVPTFMASKGRLNDDRMRVYRPDIASGGNQKNNSNTKLSSCRYISRIITRTERLKLMGFPGQYLDCLDDLYRTLLNDGHGMVNDSKHWRETLEKRYHIFHGGFHGVSNPYDFVDVPNLDSGDYGPPRCVEMRILPFLGSDYLNDKDYGKRLIGNAISVPVLEFCLAELAPIFATRRYDGYDYAYAWRHGGSSDNVPMQVASMNKNDKNE